MWVFPDSTHAWPLDDFAALIPESLQELVDKATQHAGILLIGTGKSMLPAPKALRLICQKAGIALEAMDTGAACRTYNVLLTEERAVAAALIAI